MIIYDRIIKRLIRQSYANVGTGNFAAVTSKCAPQVEHRFMGNNAFGGTRHDRATLERWFERVGRLLGRVTFDVYDIVVYGGPAHTVITARWTIHSDNLGGQAYDNRGVHIITMRWGKATKFDVYEDTVVADALIKRLTAAGVAEATASPIIS